MARIAIVEDEILIVKQLEHILKKFGYANLTSFDNSDKVIDALSKADFDLFLMDINIKGSTDGIGLAHIIQKKWGTPLIFITSYADKSTLDRAKTTMPLGYIVKPFEEKDIYSSVEIALYRAKSKPAKIISKTEVEDKFDVQLTPREYCILAQLTLGLSNAQIAESEFVSVNTVKTHLRNLYSKFDVTDRLKLVRTVLS